MEYKDIYNYVVTNGFSLFEADGDVIGGIDRFSEGIRYALFQKEAAEKSTLKHLVKISADDFAKVVDADFLQEVKDAASRFLSGDFGTFYEDDETPTSGHEYGEYRSKYGPIRMHREINHITHADLITVAYFPFEN